MLSVSPPAEIIRLFNFSVRAFKEGSILLHPGCRLIIGDEGRMALFVIPVELVYIFFVLLKFKYHIFSTPYFLTHAGEDLLCFRNRCVCSAYVSQIDFYSFRLF